MFHTPAHKVQAVKPANSSHAVQSVPVKPEQFADNTDAHSAGGQFPPGHDETAARHARFWARMDLFASGRIG